MMNTRFTQTVNARPFPYADWNSELHDVPRRRCGQNNGGGPVRAFDESVHQHCARGGRVLRMRSDSTVVCGRGTSTKESAAAREGRRMYHLMYDFVDCGKGGGGLQAG